MSQEEKSEKDQESTSNLKKWYKPNGKTCEATDTPDNAKALMADGWKDKKG